MNELNDYLRKMEAIVRKDFERFAQGYYTKAELRSCVSVNGNVEAYFIANTAALDLWLYDVIYFFESNEFRVLRYSLSDMFDVANAKD